MKAIIDNAVEAASADMSWKAIDRYSKDYIEMQTKQGVKFYKTPDADAADASSSAYDAARRRRPPTTRCSRKSRSRRRPSPQRAVRWDLDTNVNRRMAYNHYFGKAPRRPKKG